MSEQSLSIQFVNEDIDPYWLHMEIVKEEDEEGMSVGQAASIIDSLYDISVCGANSDPYNVNNTQAVNNDPTPQTFADTLQALMLTPSSCAMAGEEGAYDVDIKVFRSHPGTEIYKLRLSNGTASLPIRKEERVSHTIDVENASHYTFDNPIKDRPVIAWIGFDGPDIHIKGNTIWWDGLVTGTIKAEFDTEYDLVHIHVNGELINSQIIEGTLPPDYLGEGWYSGTNDAYEIVNIQNIQCSVLAFYHYQYEELILNRPEVDSSVTGGSMDFLCNALLGSGGPIDVDDGDNPWDYDRDCLNACLSRCSGLEGDEYINCESSCREECTRWCEQENKLTEICDCSHDETKYIQTTRVVCPSDVGTGSKLPDKTPIVKFIPCNDTDEEVDDPEFYAETCCTNWPFPNKPMPRCEIVYSGYSGDGEFSESDKKPYKDRYDVVSFVGVGPKEGICGEQSVEQVITPKNCCLDPSPVYIHPENNPSVIADNSSARIIATGGTFPFTWSVSGEGAYFLYDGRKVNKLENEGGSVILYTDDVCGTIKITISDACDQEDDYSLRAADGHWSTVVYYSWSQYQIGSENRTCSPDLPEGLEWDSGAPGEEDVTEADEDGWTVTRIVNGIKFTEQGVARTFVYTEGGTLTTCNSSQCGTRIEDRNTWPPCLPVPSVVEYVSCEWVVENFGCLKWLDAETPCCYECSGDTIVYNERYGVLVCHTGTHKAGPQIRSRRWEIWEC